MQEYLIPLPSTLLGKSPIRSFVIVVAFEEVGGGVSVVKKNVVTTMQKVEDNMDAFNKKIMPFRFICTVLLVSYLLATMLLLLVVLVFV